MAQHARIPTRLIAAASALVRAIGVLAGSGITNTGPSVINGNIGSYPTTSITGFQPRLVNGTDHAGDAVTFLFRAQDRRARDRREV